MDTDLDTEMTPVDSEASGTFGTSPPESASLPPLAWDGEHFPSLCAVIVKHLNAVNKLLREQRDSIRNLDPKDLETGWDVLLPALDRLNSTVHTVSESYEHVATLPVKMKEDLDMMKRMLEENTSSARMSLSPEPFRYSPSPRSTPPPHRAPTPSPPSLLSRISSNYIEDYNEYDRSPSPAPTTNTGRGRSRPATPYASRMSEYDTDSSRGRSPARVDVKRHPRHADRMFYIVFSNDVRPNPLARPPSSTLQTVFSGFLEHNPQLGTASLDKVEWGSGGNLTFVLSSPPSDPVMSLFRDRALTLFNIPKDKHGDVIVRRHEFRVHIGIRRIPCIRNMQQVNASVAAEALAKDPDWKLVLGRAGTVVRWGSKAEGVTARMLVVEILDDSHFSTAHYLRKRTVSIFGCDRRPFILRDKVTTPQCTNCWVWGHPGSKCNLNYEVCAHCSGSHETFYHSAMAQCCADRPDRDTTPCPHPPRCRNCFGAHFSNDRQRCPYAKHRNDSNWYHRQPGPVTDEHPPAPLHILALPATMGGPATIPIPSLRNDVASSTPQLTAAREHANDRTPASTARVRFGPTTVHLFDANLPPQNASVSTDTVGGSGRQGSGRGGQEHR